MAGNTYQLVVDAVYKGGGAFQQASRDLSGLDNTARSAGARLSGGLAQLGVAAGAFGLAMAGVAAAAGKAYSVLREGAALVTTQQRFDKLSASIGTTADTLLGKLRTATKGMISDMELMSSASGIISLRLAENEDQVIRLATVVGTLGWDMQQVILTFANLSTMRLDALGLSVEEVKNKQKELMEQGISEVEAFKEAVILAGEARLDVGGVSDAEASFKQAEAAVTNYKNALLLSITATLDQAGAFDLMAEAAKNIGGFPGFVDEVERLRDAGEITDQQYRILNATIRRGGVEAAEAALEHMLLSNALYETGDNVEANRGAWAQWALATSIALSAVDENAGQTFVNIANGLAQADAAMMNSAANFMRLNEWTQSTTNRYAVWIDSINKRNRAAEEERAQLLESEKSMYSYGASLGGVISAEQALAEAHQRMASAFSGEISADLSEGLIDEAGLVNMENANELLFEQARAAGATASQLAMLGIATGQFTQEQAAAALKAAILSEKIKQIAEAVASGQLGYGEAAGSLASFGEQLNAGAIADVQAGIDGAAQAADDFAMGAYNAELSVESQAAMAAIDDAQVALNTLVGGTYVIHITTSGANITGFGGVVTGTGTGTPLPAVDEDNRIGGKGVAVYGGGVNPGSTGGMYTTYNGGSSVNVTVTNYVDGKAAGRDYLDDVTEDSLKRALNELGMGRR